MLPSCVCVLRTSLEILNIGRLGNLAIGPSAVECRSKGRPNPLTSTFVHKKIPSPVRGCDYHAMQCRTSGGVLRERSRFRPIQYSLTASRGNGILLESPDNGRNLPNHLGVDSIP